VNMAGKVDVCLHHLSLFVGQEGSNKRPDCRRNGTVYRQPNGLDQGSNADGR